MYSPDAVFAMVEAIAPLPAPVQLAIRAGADDRLPEGGLLNRIWMNAIAQRSAWIALAEQAIDYEELVDALTKGAPLSYEPESESVSGEWLKDEWGIPYFRPFPSLDDDYRDGTAMYGNHAIV